jgi:Polysaccharide pyruvyl transferase
MNDAPAVSFSAAGVPAKTVQADIRIPAVIGTLPWSWRGDDNTGNMIHAAAARRMMSTYAEWGRPGEWTEADIEQLKSQHSHLVFVTANLIRHGVRGDHPSIKELIAGLVPLARNIERAGLPVVVFGLGSQADLNSPSEFTVAPETVRLLQVISGHSRKIAVRGTFTAEACVRLGIKNVEVIGCQSIFWHRSPQFSWKLSNPAPDARNRIAFNFTDALLEANLINQAIGRGDDFIGQQNDAEEDLKAQAEGAASVLPNKFNWAVEMAFKKGIIDQQQYEHWIRHHFYQFRQPEPWLEHLRRYCFSYGTRLHGNMAAMIAGTRALWIVHDMRTKELCDHFGLPFVELKEVCGGANLEALFDRADYSRCVQVYPERYRALFEYVDGAGLPHSLPRPLP